jgi:hypothetical protein
MSYTDAQWAEWCRTFDEPTQAAAPTVINNYYFIDASTNIQAIVNPGQTSARLVDGRSRLADDVRGYLPQNYQPGNMDETAQKLLAPMTKEEKAGAGPWQCF